MYFFRREGREIKRKRLAAKLNQTNAKVVVAEVILQQVAHEGALPGSPGTDYKNEREFWQFVRIEKRK